VQLPVGGLVPVGKRKQPRADERIGAACKVANQPRPGFVEIFVQHGRELSAFFCRLRYRKLVFNTQARPLVVDIGYAAVQNRDDPNICWRAAGAHGKCCVLRRNRHDGIGTYMLGSMKP